MSVALKHRDLAIIDVDSHFTEPPDLWTSRAPAKFKDRVPQVAVVDGKRQWVMDGKFFATMRAHSGVLPDLSKGTGLIPTQLEFEQVHASSHNPKERLKLMDEIGIWAQILYPNKIGFGGATLGKYDDDLKLATVQIYNDALAEIQQETNTRICGMGILPWWDVKLSVAEAERCHKMGLRGLTINPDPQLQGLPDLATTHWTPLFDVFEGLNIPLNFHIGAGGVTDWFTDTPWPSLHDEQKLAIGTTAVIVHNIKPISNLIMSGLLERHPKLKVVSVESGAGWIPFLLEALDYSAVENMLETRKVLSMKPSEYFKRNMYACFWFESRNIVETIRQLGENNVLFETDFPHPTCLYPNAYERVAEALSGLDKRVQRKVTGGNAAKLYNIPLPPGYTV